MCHVSCEDENAPPVSLSETAKSINTKLSTTNRSNTRKKKITDTVTLYITRLLHFIGQIVYKLLYYLVTWRSQEIWA